jgi:hypothetical protein
MKANADGEQLVRFFRAPQSATDDVRHERL